MKHRSILCLFIIWSLLGVGRSQTTSAIQYRMTIMLDDDAHTLRGNWEMDYTNTSADTLHRLYLHVWPNAYRNERTPLARQLLRAGVTDWHFAPDTARGGIDGLSFSVGDVQVQPIFNEWAPDIYSLPLPQPLLPGQQITLRTPMRVRLPALVSRLGHADQSYQLTQWFPKVAMYDDRGWWPMSYLDYGEYYGPFADYDVRIRVPENYLVAATGRLQTSRERDWLAAEDRTGTSLSLIPPSATTYKTLHYTAERVVDFAWFTDKRFRYHRDSLSAAGRSISLEVFHTGIEADRGWEQATTYVKEAIEYFSARIGPYPYEQMTVVQSPESSSGMEYPTITLIGSIADSNDLIDVIAHEVVHNWFYAALATNERHHAWLDEGLATYYSNRFMRDRHPRAAVNPGILSGNLAAFAENRRHGQVQIADQSAASLTPDNYWLSAYDLPEQAWRHLAAWVGEDRLDAAVAEYYRQWQFGHPTPDDLQQVLATELGVDLDWLFGGLLGSKDEIDYAIERVEHGESTWQIQLRNRGGIAAPVPLVSETRDGVETVYWLPGFARDTMISVPAVPGQTLALDPDLVTLEVNRTNNYHRRGADRPWRLRWGLGAEQPSYRQVFVNPLILYNVYDGLMPGLTFNNQSLPLPRTRWIVAPAYGLRKGTLTGYASVDFSQPRHTANGGHFGAGLRAYRFGFRQPPGEAQALRYAHAEAYGQATFYPAQAIRPVRRSIRAELLTNVIDRLRVTPDGVSRIEQDHFVLWRIGHTWHNERVLAPFRWHTQLEYQSFDDAFARRQSYLKWQTELSGKLLYRPDRAFHYRFFGGWFPYNTGRRAGSLLPGAFSLVPLGSYDYAFEHFYLGRTETQGITSQQLGRWDGAFKTPIAAGQPLGRSNNYAWAINLGIDVPGTPDWLVFRPYLDIGYADDATPFGAGRPFNTQVVWNAGVGLSWAKDRVGIYFPLFGSTNVQNLLAERGGYLKRIGFRLDIGAALE